MKSHKSAAEGASSSSSSSASTTSSSSHGKGAKHHRIASVRPSKEKGHGKFIKGKHDLKADIAEQQSLTALKATKPGGVSEIAKKLTAILETTKDAVEQGDYSGFNSAIEKYVAECSKYLDTNQLGNPLTPISKATKFNDLKKQNEARKADGHRDIKLNSDSIDRALIKDFISDATRIIKSRTPIFNDTQTAQEIAMLEVIGQLRDITIRTFASQNNVQIGDNTVEISTITDTFSPVYNENIPQLLEKYKALFKKEVTAIDDLLNPDHEILPQMINGLQVIFSKKNQEIKSIQEELNQLNKLIYSFYNLNENGSTEKKTHKDIMKLIVQQESVGNISIFKEQITKLAKALGDTNLGDQPLSLVQSYLIDDEVLWKHKDKDKDKDLYITDLKLIQCSRELFQKLVIAQNEAAQIQKQISTIEDLQETQRNDHSHSQNQHSAVAPALKRGDAKISLEDSKETKIKKLQKNIKDLNEKVSNNQMQIKEAILALSNMTIENMLKQISCPHEAKVADLDRKKTAEHKKITKAQDDIKKLDQKISKYQQEIANIEAQTKIESDQELQQKLDEAKKALHKAESDKNDATNLIAESTESVTKLRQEIEKESEHIELFNRAHSEVKKNLSQKGKEKKAQQSNDGNQTEEYKKFYSQINDVYKTQTTKEYQNTKKQHEKTQNECQKTIKGLRKQLFTLQIELDQAELDSAKKDFIETTKLIEDYLKLDKDYDILKILESFIQLTSENQHDEALKSKIQEIIGRLSNLPNVISEGSSTEHTINDEFKSMENLLSCYKAIAASNVKSNALQKAMNRQVTKFLALEEQYKTEQKEYIEAFSDLAHGKILGEAGKINQNAVKLLFEFVGKLSNHDFLNIVKIIMDANPDLDLSSLRDHNGATLLHKFVTTESIDFEVAEFFVKNHPSLMGAKDNYGDSFMHDLADLLIELAPSSLEEYETEYQIKPETQKVYKYNMYKNLVKFITQNYQAAIDTVNNESQNFFLYLFDPVHAEKTSDLISEFFSTDMLQYLPLQAKNELGQNLGHLLALNATYAINYYKDIINDDSSGNLYVDIFYNLLSFISKSSGNSPESINIQNFTAPDNSNSTIGHYLSDQQLPDMYLIFTLLDLDLTSTNIHNESIVYNLLANGNCIELLEEPFFSLNGIETKSLFTYSNRSNKNIIDLCIEKGVFIELLCSNLISKITGFGEIIGNISLGHAFMTICKDIKVKLTVDIDYSNILQQLAKIYKTHLNKDGTISTISPEELTQKIINLMQKAEHPESHHKSQVIANEKPGLNAQLSLDPDDYPERQSTSGAKERDSAGAEISQMDDGRNHTRSIFGIDSEGKPIFDKGPSWFQLPRYASVPPVGGAATGGAHSSEMDGSLEHGASRGDELGAGFSAPVKTTHGSVSASQSNSASSSSSSSGSIQSRASQSSHAKGTEALREGPSSSVSAKSTPSQQKESICVPLGPERRPGSESAEGRDMGSESKVIPLGHEGRPGRDLAKERDMGSDSKAIPLGHERSPGSDSAEGRPSYNDEGHPTLRPRDGSDHGDHPLMHPPVKKAGSDRALVHPDSTMKSEGVVSSFTTIVGDDTSDIGLAGAFTHTGE